MNRQSVWIGNGLRTTVLMAVVVLGVVSCAHRVDPTLTPMPVYRMSSSILVETPPDIIGEGAPSILMGDGMPSGDQIPNKTNKPVGGDRR